MNNNKEMFNEEQRKQIELGKEKGLDISVYDKPEYNCAKMIVLRQLLMIQKSCNDLIKAITDDNTWFITKNICDDMSDISFALEYFSNNFIIK